MATDSRRAPRFELHVRPLMRLLDRERMLGLGVDLWDYDSVRAKARKIRDHIRSDMPPVPYGGLWPREWVELFERWMHTGYRRLEIGKPNLEWDVSRSGDVVTVLGQSELPHETYEGWIEPTWRAIAGRVYTLYWRDPDDPIEGEPIPREVVFEESYAVELTEEEVVIVDANGAHRFEL